MARGRTHGRIEIAAVVSSIVDRLASRRHGRKVLTANPDADRALLARQRAAFARTAGILRDAENPDWETPEKTSAWVRKLRAVDNRSTEDMLSPRSTP